MSAQDQPDAAASTLALKEWAAVAAALLDGRQTLLLRKGGIHEKAFMVQGSGEAPSAPGSGEAPSAPGGRFVLFPTVAHSHAERVRPEHRDALDAGAADVGDGTFVVRCGLTLVAAVAVTRPEGLAQIADLHIWTAESVHRDRLAFRPKHHLAALVVRAVELPRPARLRRLEAYGGCKSWLRLPLHWDGRSGRQVHTERRLADDFERVLAAVA